MTKYCPRCGEVSSSKLKGEGSYPCICLACWLREEYQR